MDFVTCYGLLGFMTALPTTPGFITCHAVYLLKNHFIKEESMTTKKYLSYFFLFDKIDFVKKGISRHLAKIFESGELDEEMIVAKIAITTQHGAMQDKTAFGKDYFRELLERVCSIRASERRIQQQITDIFAGCSIDYDRDSDTAYHFYATIQNKFHYAITGKTAAEIVYNQADHNSENMGLTTWENAPDGRILKSDTPIAKKTIWTKNRFVNWNVLLQGILIT